jgi:hypothetical protein
MGGRRIKALTFGRHVSWHSSPPAFSSSTPAASTIIQPSSLPTTDLGLEVENSISSLLPLRHLSSNQTVAQHHLLLGAIRTRRPGCVRRVSPLSRDQPRNRVQSPLTDLAGFAMRLRVHGAGLALYRGFATYVLGNSTALMQFGMAQSSVLQQLERLLHTALFAENR